MGVSELGNPSEVRADAVIGGIIYHNRLCIGVIADSLFDLRDRHSEGDTELLVDVGVDVYRHGSGEDKSVYSASVDVSGHDYLVALLAGVHYHALDCRGSSADHEECICSLESLSREHFRVLDDGDGVAEVIEGLHGVDIDVHAVLAEKFSKLHIAATALVTGHIEGDYPHAAEFAQSLVYRSIYL